MIGLLVFVCAFGLFGFTTSSLVGYEPETAAVTEGLVKTGRFQILRDSPLRSEGHVGRGGRLYGRVGVPQPLLEAPFYAAGWAADSVAHTVDPYAYRRLALLFYNPFVMAVAAALVFAIVLRLRRSTRWAVAVALIFAAASIAWPYSKIGMEATLTMAFALFVLAVLLAAERRSIARWALAGFAGGMAVAIKPYMAAVLLPAAAILWPVLRDAGWRERARLLAALALPFAVWLGAIAWYDYARQGSVFDLGDAAYNPTLAAPFNAIGFLVSPGKGLFFYSPIVVLGLLGLRRMAREQPRVAAMLGASFVIGILVVAGSSHWTDETWGPRYIVAVSWLPLVALPWFAASLRARRVLIAGVAVSVFVQLLAVLGPYYVYLEQIQNLSGLDIYATNNSGQRLAASNVPLGRDPTRWIPQLSPLVFRGAVVLSKTVDALGGHALTYTYRPYEGLPRRVDLTGPEHYVPDFFWANDDDARNLVFGFGALLLLGCGWAGLRGTVLPGGGARHRPRRGSSPKLP